MELSILGSLLFAASDDIPGASTGMSIGAYLGLLLPPLVAIAGATWFLATRMAKIDQNLEDGKSQTSGMCDAVLELWRGLTAVGGIGDGAKSRIVSAMTVVDRRKTDDFLRTLGANPFSEEEINTLKDYWSRVQHGDRLLESEARQFKALAERARHEHPNEPGAIGLAVLAGLALGVALGAILSDK